MSWYDYVPIVGSVANAIQHPSLSSIGGAALDIGTGGMYGAGKDLYDAGKYVYDKYKGAVDEQKQGDLAAAAEAKQLGDTLYGQQMQGLNRAENYYIPAQQAIRAAYGSPGAITGGPSQYPVAPPVRR